MDEKELEKWVLKAAANVVPAGTKSLKMPVLLKFRVALAVQIIIKGIRKRGDNFFYLFFGHFFGHIIS